MAAAVLLASRDLMTVQAQAVGSLLEQGSIPHRVVTDDDELGRLEVGGFSRAGEVRTASSPVIEVRTPDVAPPGPMKAVAVLAFALAACAAMSVASRGPALLKGAVLVVVAVGAVSAAYGAWVDPLPPLDVRSVAVDWRQTPLIAMVVVSFLFWYDLYPHPGSFVLKTAWVVVALGAMWAFSIVRLAVVVAAYERFGPGAFLAAHQWAGAFWDLVPGIAVLALAHSSVEWSARVGPRLAWWAR